MADSSASIVLVPATEAALEGALSDHRQLAAAVDANVPGDWPPERFERDLIERTLQALRHGDADAELLLHFVVVEDPGGGRTLAGVVGFDGPPDAAGTVDLGFAIVRSLQRHGYARDAVQRCIQAVRGRSEVRRIVADALRDDAASHHLLQRQGFRPTGAGADRDVLRFELAC